MTGLTSFPKLFSLTDTLTSMNIGAVVKKMRDQAGLRQDQLAEMAGITQSYLSQIENGRREPNLSTLRRISDHLEVAMPVLVFLALEEGDIPEGKRDAYEAFYPEMRSLLKKEIFNDEGEMETT